MKNVRKYIRKESNEFYEKQGKKHVSDRETMHLVDTPPYIKDTILKVSKKKE